MGRLARRNAQKRRVQEIVTEIDKEKVVVVEEDQPIKIIRRPMANISGGILCATGSSLAAAPNFVDNPSDKDWRPFQKRRYR